MLFTNNRYGKNFAKDPAVIYHNSRYYLYHSVFDNNGKLRIDIAESSNGADWTLSAQLPLEQDCERNGIGAPGAIVLDGRVHLFYQTYGNGKHDAICHAVSDDGVNFIKNESNPVYHPTDDWCCGRAIDADVCVFGGKLYLYAATRDHKFDIQMLGYAVAELDSGFTRESFVQEYADTILLPEFDWEGKCIEAPATIVRDGLIHMFYGGAYNCSPQQIGYAVSADGCNFKRVSDVPFMTNGDEDTWNRHESGHPYVFEDIDGTVWLYYQGSADMGKTWYLSRVRLNYENERFVLS